MHQTIKGLSADTLRFISVDLIVFGIFAQEIIPYVLSISTTIIFTLPYAGSCPYAHLIQGHDLGP